MIKKKFSNGLNLLIDKQKSNIVSIQITVHTGSNHETPSKAGISHFMEHLIFEGTKTRNAKEIAESIEKTGGEFNAMTTNEYTSFYIKVPKKDKKYSISILYDIVKNSLFDLNAIEKERKVILEEIAMYDDEPSHFQWLIFMEKLFGKHPAGRAIAGYKNTVKKISRKDILNFYNKYYVPQNMIITSVGEVCLADFNEFKKLKGAAVKHKQYPLHINKKSLLKYKKNIGQNYYIKGWSVSGSKHKDSVVLGLLSAILYKGLSGRVAEEIRNKRGLAYTAGCTYEEKSTYGIFAFYINCAKKNLNVCRSILEKVIKSLENISNEELKDAKSYIIGRHQVASEDSLEKIEELTEAKLYGDSSLGKNYLKKVAKVTQKDLQRVIKKYFTSKSTEIILY